MALRIYNRVLDQVNAVARIIILMMIGAIFAIVVVTVFTRFTFSFVLSWSEEVPRYLLIWVTFLTGAIAVDRKDHIALDLIVNRLPSKARAPAQFLINLGLASFGVILAVFGYRFVQDFGGDFMESLPFTNIWYYTSLPVSGTLIVLFALRDQLNLWFAPDLRTRRVDVLGLE